MLRLMALVSEVCGSCGLQLRYFSRKYSSSQLADYYETGLCARCCPKEGEMVVYHIVGYWQGGQDEVLKTFRCRKAAELWLRYTSLLDPRLRRGEMNECLQMKIVQD